MTRNRVLVAGIGNIFRCDDGFGAEVARRLLTDAPVLPDDVRVVDYGIRSVHLAYDLLDGYDVAILVDACARGGAPGTIYVIEPDRDDVASERRLGEAGIVDGHAMDAASVLALVQSLGGRIHRLLVVGCEPASIDDGMTLSVPVAAAVDEACHLVRELASEEIR